MPDHGALVNSRRYWVSVDAKGKQVVTDQPPTGGSAGFLGIGASPAPAATEYEERTYEDGTRVVSRWDPQDTQWKQESVEVDSGLAQQYKESKKPPPKEGEAPTTKEFPDGSMRQWNPESKQWEKIADAPPPKPEKPPERPATVAVPGQYGEPRTVTTAQAAEERATRAEVRQLTQDEVNRKKDDLQMQVQQGQLSLAQANAEFSRWYQTRQVEDQQARTEIARQAEARAGRAEERAATTAERSQDLAERQFARGGQQYADTLRYNQTNAAYGVGENAVQDYLRTAPLRVGPQFGAHFADALRTISGGGGQVNFGPQDFTYQIPDLGALRDREVARALSVFQNATPPAAPVPGQLPAPLPGTPPPAPIFPTSAPAAPWLPPGYPSMPR